MSVNVRAIAADEVGAMLHAVSLGFGFDGDPRVLEAQATVNEVARNRCAFDGRDIIGTLGAYSLDLAVPGATVATAGTTQVSVRASHRRRGVLRALMAAHFEDVRARREPLAALWASEAGIYGRFGFGCASDLARVEIERAHADFARPLEGSGRCRMLDAAAAARELPEIYEALWRARPGSFARSQAWWDARHLADPAPLRGGASALRRAVYERDGAALGFVQYRTKMAGDEHGLPRGEMIIGELHGADAQARAALWRFALDVDLIDRIWWWNAPLDDPLPWLLTDARRAMRRVRDGLWLRIMDVPRALSGRCYACEGRLTLQVSDGILIENTGSWSLEGGPQGAKCTRGAAAADVELGVDALGAIYLGGVRPSALAQAGWIRGEPAALARADAMFSWDRLPWCPEIF
jgi:predicted acetyltransferase